ncbi:M42 family metallopeptidase [Methanolapillus millepedarum]|uniref:Aminopeptidase YsdC n=1 Tax=Methanolapillus millepedarum TaxID=3028296 RepID=A0AA96V541_9EURY|nr:Putative aminopeptidase YsdC [Methanosarcinaceae archaeon Ac7]
MPVQSKKASTSAKSVPSSKTTAKKAASQGNLNSVSALLEKYANAYGVSGDEQRIYKLAKEDLKACVDEIQEDPLGNLIAVRRGSTSGPVIMLAAHMDEIGLMVKRIDENGFLKFAKIGGWFDQTLLNQRVIVHGSKGDLYGVIGSKPPHVMTAEDAKHPVKHTDMFIDIGAKDAEDAAKMGIEAGTYVSTDREFRKLANDRVTSKAFDNRAGLVIMIEAMRRLKDKKIEATVCAVGTVQEEVGLKGAKTSAYAVDADVALAIDTTIPGDHPGISKNDSALEIGKGPVVTIADASGRGLIAHPTVVKWIRESAKSKKIDVQLGVGEGGTTDATSIHLTKEGIPTGTISIATRYIHSPVEVLDLNDIEACVTLVVAAAENAHKYFSKKN